MEPLNPVTKRWLIYVGVFFATVGLTQLVRAVDAHNMGVVGLTLRHGDGKDPIQQNQSQALPPYRNGCEVDLGWTAVPGKLVSTSSKF